MRLIKMFGLAAIAAVAAMAFVGATSAMAESTTLCEEDVATCPTNKQATAIHQIDPAAVLLSSIINVTCEALFAGTIATPLASPLVIKGAFTYTNCNNGECEAKEVSKGVTVEVLKEGTELAKVTGKGEILVKCGSFIHCVYNGTSLTGHGLGPLVTGDNGHVTFANVTVNKVSGFLCPSTASLDALFVSLNALYIRN